ncbi:type VII secretion protein EccB [Streptomyces sp. ACA25]|uniref:type VII secretion protein EccB n=1 Tax=Streptomyces sp. ACA25 TaxID=3022596 RepID=UPI002307F418|nr:type VII secretion protein EccB [Streptomyces sp. ACA25]MDB1089718.1 type VII secretion protein EccB [Streptomyces sp. ACA25]
MASRKDELNAYTYARKRTVAAFLQPSPTGTEEGAPRPLRAVLPGLIAGALILAGFGAWGMFKPSAPRDWNDPGRNVIVGSESTTRYVVLETDGKAHLHPVLNLSSARLLLDPSGFGIVSVDEKELDSGRIPHGPALGIPYAPDRLPAAGDAGEAKRWAVCQQPDGDGRSVRQAVFVLADRDAGRVDGPHRLTGGQMLYVQGPDQERYLVDAEGTKYLIGGPDPERLPAADRSLLLRSLVGDGPEPQRVTEEWLATFDDGSPVEFPALPGTVGEPAGAPVRDAGNDRVGTVLLAPTGAGPQHYVVLPGQVVPVSGFTARLLLDSPAAAVLGQEGLPRNVGVQAFTPAPAAESIDRQYTWPAETAQQVNRPDGNGSRDTVCSVLRGVDPQDGSTRLSTWAGPAYPAAVGAGAGSAYVTPGSGLLYRQVQGEQAEAGGVFLVTDTGLRYAVQSNTDSGGEDDTGDLPGQEEQGGGDEGEDPAGVPSGRAEQAQARLGYGGVEPVPVPAQWSRLLPTGPRLDTDSARQPQGS